MDKEKELSVFDRKAWHAGFAGGLELCFRKYKDKLTYDREYLLAKEPLKIDFIVIRNDEHALIDNSVGRLFCTYNLVEYKNPYDDLNIDVLWKVIGYAAIYKSLGKSVNIIPMDEVTISIFRSSKPVKLFKLLKEEGILIEKTCPGVYYLKGMVRIAMQVIVTAELEDEDVNSIRILRKNADEEIALKFVKEALLYTEQGDKENANAVLHLFNQVNKILITERGEGKTMYEALRELFENEFVISEQKGESRHIVSQVCRKLRKGKTTDQIAEELDEDYKTIESICKVAKKYAPDYDENKILEKIMEKQTVKA